MIRIALHLACAVACGAALLVTCGVPVAAATATGPTLTGVIDSLRTWLVGLLAALATLFLTLAGVRYLMAGGDAGEVERAKGALRSAAIGYALAALAPLLVGILRSLVGA
jgi:cyanate permease